MKKKVVETKVSKRRVIEGKVVSNKMQNTVKVVVESKTKHSVYKKVINKRRVFFAHTDKELNEGDMVKIKESRPFSKNVKWVVID